MYGYLYPKIAECCLSNVGGFGFKAWGVAFPGQFRWRECRFVGSIEEGSSNPFGCGLVKVFVAEPEGDINNKLKMHQPKFNMHQQN